MTNKGTTDVNGHVTRFSDSALYDYVCVNCGATDATWDGLGRKCPNSPSKKGVKDDGPNRLRTP
jgi:hypothetical protein